MTMTFSQLDYSLFTAIAAGVAYALCAMLATMGASRRYYHILQLNSYQIDGYWRSLRRYAKHDVWPGLLIVGACALVALLTAWALAPWPVLSAIGSLALPLITFAALSRLRQLKQKEQKQKLPLVMTERLIRLRKTHVAVCVVSSSIAALLGWWLLSQAALTLPLAALLFVAIALLPYGLCFALVALSAHLRAKPEQRVNQGFIDDAKRILEKRPDLLKIGITGSFGKTSAKFILGTILSEQYDVLVPPASYNTPMGVVRMVREMLEPAHQAMICEMGARHVGDIKELVDIVHPSIALITSIGKQHLETFHTIENIVSTKYEIMQQLGEAGIGCFPNDGSYGNTLYDQHRGKKLRFGFGEAGNDVYATDITVNDRGSSFILHAKGEMAPCATVLLGEHNIMNILGCAAVALSVGLSIETIAAGIMKVAPIEHRLQLMDPGTGVLIIDDAFNSNPNGAQRALDVLSLFTNRRKICVTPGMVELGETEYEENRRFGQRMAAACDLVILVGAGRAKPMVEGLKAQGFDEGNLFVVNNLDEATAVIAAHTRAGDIILFENDLPDHYVD